MSNSESESSSYADDSSSYSEDSYEPQNPNNSEQEQEQYQEEQEQQPQYVPPIKTAPVYAKTNGLKSYAQTLAEKVIESQRQRKEEQKRIEKEIKERQKQIEREEKQRQKQYEKEEKQRQKQYEKEQREYQKQMEKQQQSQLRGAARQEDDNEAQLTYLMNMVDEQLQNYQKGDYQTKTTVSQMLNEYKKLGIINLKQKTDIMKLFK